jgi:hypothetical protein
MSKWLHEEGESEVREARALRNAHVKGELDAHILDLAVTRSATCFSAHCTGQPMTLPTSWKTCKSSLARRLRWHQLADIAANLGHTHGLSFYDACWAATALQIPLISADRQLLAAGLAESPTAITTRLRLRR